MAALHRNASVTPEQVRRWRRMLGMPAEYGPSILRDAYVWYRYFGDEGLRAWNGLRTGKLQPPVFEWAAGTMPDTPENAAFLRAALGTKP